MDNIQRVSVSLDQDTRKTIEDLAHEKRQNFSAGLRLIVSEWAEMKQNSKPKETAQSG